MNIHIPHHIGRTLYCRICVVTKVRKKIVDKKKRRRKEHAPSNEQILDINLRGYIPCICESTSKDE